MRSHSDPVTSWKRVGEVMPALLTSAPTGGAEASNELRADSTDVSSVTSQARPKAWTPLRSAISSAASLAAASSRSRMATFQPSAASVWAVARPMPRVDAAPVTMAVKSEWDMVWFLLFGVVGLAGCQAVGGWVTGEARSTLFTMASVDRP